MYKYTCTNCGHIQYGGSGISKARCNHCNSLKFGLKKKEWVTIEEREELKRIAVINHMTIDPRQLRKG